MLFLTEKSWGILKSDIGGNHVVVARFSRSLTEGSGARAALPSRNPSITSCVCKNSPENLKRVTMASATCKVSLLVQLMIFHVRLNILQKACKWIRSHTQRKTEVQKLTKKFFVKDDDDFAKATEAVEEQPSDFDRCDQSKEKNSSYHSGGPAGRSCCGKKNKLKLKRNTVTPNERHAWNEDTAVKKRHSHTLRLFGSRSRKASNVKSDFDKPYDKNANV